MSTPIDISKGIALECERDEFGNFTHTLWIDAEVYQITESAWEKLMQFNFDRFEEGKHFAEERIIKLLESKLCWCVGQPLNKDNGKEELMKHMNCDWQAMMIEYHVALIKGEQNA